ncbi:uncharacterized protein LOC119072210 [Bradysia coprophila]|uniref:uncharacterized protein LOC119072210 n=1 Tax=Bradysia coprophila TaxID=38358 RepID=UPI00187DBB94|nr:uncharacterized protein LOC119072210 [Bradysia coprophila]
MAAFDLSFGSDISITDFLSSSFDDLHQLNAATDALIESQKCVANDFIDKIIIIYLRHNLSLVCLEDLMRLLNVNREICEQLPTNKKQILNLFRENKDMIEIVYFVRCAKCRKIVKKNADNLEQLKCCDIILKKSETNFYVYMPLEKQIIQSIEANWNDIKNFDTTSKDGSISDAHDGEILKNVLRQYTDSDINILSLCLNVDGANKFNSNLISLWPIQFLQNFLPPKIRFLPKNILVSGLLYTEGSFDFREYFLPLINEMNNVKKTPIVMSLDNAEFTFKPVVTHCAVDLPAKSKLQETKQFGGYNACTFCHIPGKQVLIYTKSGKNKTNKQKQNKSGKDGKQMKCVRYPAGTSYPLREEKETLRSMLAASTSKDKIIDGIKDVSCLVALEHFHVVNSISCEYMHSVLLGVVKQILNFFCNPKNSKGKFYITKKNRKLLNKRILEIKPNCEVARKPRSLEQLSTFKASEFRSMLLFYMPVCLAGLVPDVFVKHVRLLSAAVYKLLKSTIPIEEVDEAGEMLDRFVEQHQKLFGIEAMVMNVHLLTHLVDSVRALGPLWTHSAFPFERNNGVLLKKVNGTTDVLLQISSKYCLEKSMMSRREKPIIKEKVLLGRRFTMADESLCVFDIERSRGADLSNKTLSVHKRIKLKNIIYTSTSYTLPKKSVDYFVGLQNDMIGKAKFYYESGGNKYVVLEEFEIIDTIDHILKVAPTRRNILASINDINQKYLYMTVGTNQYISSVPNTYEKE